MIKQLLALLLLASSAWAGEAEVKALSPTAWWKSYKGLTVASTRVISAVADQSGNSRTLTQAGADAIKPVITRGDNRENRLLYSEDGTNAAWNKTGYPSSIAGTTLTADAGVARHGIYQTVTSSAVAAQSYVCELEVGYNNHQYIVLGDAGDSVWHVVVLDALNGTLGTQTNVTATLTTVSPGRYNVVMTFTRTQTGNMNCLAAFGDASNNTSAPSFAAAGTEKFEFYKAAQRSALADSTYVKTTTAGEYRGVCNTAKNHCLPAMHFDGVDDYLTSTATTGDIFAAGAKSVFGLFRASGGGYILSNNGTARFYIYGDTTPDLNVVNNDGSPDITTSAAYVLNTLRGFTALHSSGNIYVKLDGGSFGAPVASGDTGVLTSAIWVGARGDASNFFNGDIIELITFNTALSTANQAVVEAYLNSVMSASADPWKRVSVLP